MRLRNKIILTFCIVALIFFSSAAGVILYYYQSPAKVKSLVEKAVSRSTKSSFTIKELSYSLRPLKIQIKGINFKPIEEGHDFRLEIGDIIANMAIEGRIGHKTLIFQVLKINGLSLNVLKGVTLPEIHQDEGDSSLFGNAMKGIIGIFLFRDIKFHGAELISGDILARSGDQTIKVEKIHGILSHDHLITIDCSAQMQLPSQKISLIAPHVRITTDDAISLVDPKIKCMVTAEKGTFKGPYANVKDTALKAKLFYNHRHKNFSFDLMDLRLDGVTSTQLSAKSPPLSLNITSKGTFSLPDNQLDIPGFHIGIKEFLQLNGKLNAVLGTQTVIELKSLECNLSPEKIRGLLPLKIQGAISPFHLIETITIKGGIKGMKPQEKWRLHPDLQVLFNHNPYSYIKGDVQFKGRLTGKIKVQGEFPDLMISSRIEGNETVLETEGIELKPSNATLSLTGRNPLFEIEYLTLQMPQVRIRMGEKEILIDDIQVKTAKGKIDLEKKALLLPEISLNSSLLKNLLLNMKADKKQIVVQLQGGDVRLIESASALNLLPPGWQFSGLDSIKVKATVRNNKTCSFSSRLSFKDFAFQDRESVCMGEKVTMTARADGEFKLKDFIILTNTTLEVQGGEVLYDRFYLDLSQNEFTASFNGKYDMSAKALDLSSLRVGLKDIITLNMRGTLHQQMGDQRVHVSLNIPETPLKPVFQNFILEPFKTEKPFLTNLDLKGNVSADLILTGNKKDWSAKGHCIWHDGQFSISDGVLSFNGIKLNLPVWYHCLKTSNEQSCIPRDLRFALTSGKHLKGKLFVRSMALPMLPEQPLNMKINAGPNRLSIRSPTIIKIPGGEVRVGPLAFRDIFMPHMSIDTSITLNDIRIQPLLTGIWPHPLKGTINGNLEPVHYEGNTLMSSGEINANIFGGSITFSRIGASGMLTPTSVYKLDAVWHDLNLAEMTTGTSFGKIQGSLNGHLKNLEVAYGQPQRFDLLMETVKKKGVPQKISVKALDNIAQIGGGSSPFIGLAGVFTSLFKEFPYKKIGVHAMLENDVFRINGTVREGGVEYLIRRGGFSGVNVVNQNPDNRISFKDMVKRIKRITASRESPVVK